MTLTTTVDDREVDLDHESSLPYVASGVLLFGFAGWLTYHLFDGLGRARDAIARYESAHGPLDTVDW